MEIDALLEKNILDHIEIVPDVLARDAFEDPTRPYYDPGSRVLGIPKRVLAREFWGVRERYKELLAKQGGSGGSVADNCGDELYQLTTLCLVATTENVQAIHTRRQLAKDPLHELRFLNCLFSSPLPKHTKSPMLWQYRRWLVTTVDKSLLASESQYLSVTQRPHERNRGATLSQNEAKVSPDLWLLYELRIVLLAAELHPRNYYAWSYARWLVTEFGDAVEWAPLANWLFYDVCSMNVSDISMWSFLDYVLANIDDPSLYNLYADHTLSLCELVPGHETLFYFLRTTIARADSSTQPALLDKLASLKSVSNKPLAETTLKWIPKLL